MRKILVTGTGGTGTGASILQALGYVNRWETLAVDMEPFSWGLYAADSGELVPGPDSPHYLSRILELIEGHGISAIIPGTEPEAVLLADHRDELPVPVIANRTVLLPLMRDKHSAQAKLKELGLPYIPSYPWYLREKALREFGLPLVVKPMKNTSGSRGLFLLTNYHELDLDFPECDVQPYLGDADCEYTVGVLSTLTGRVIDSIVIRRKLTGFTLHTSREYEGRRVAVSTGFTQGYIVRDDLIQDFCENLAMLLDSRGPLNIQLRVHDGKPYAFEIHPRFSASTVIRASAGFNEPDVLLRHWLNGEEPGRLDYQVDVAAIRAFSHVLVPAGEIPGES